jgi:two-component system, chemotaxis family, chemotaxis protein CheY
MDVNDVAEIGSTAQQSTSLAEPQGKGKLNILIAEDDFASRRALQVYLSPYGDCAIAVNGIETVAAFKDALEAGEPYDLICLDITMPEMTGHEALTIIREVESEHGICGLDSVKVIMTSALTDSMNVMGSFREGCEAYIVKPVSKAKLFEEMHKLMLI